MERVFMLGDAGEGKLKTFKNGMLGRLDFSRCLLTHTKGVRILTKTSTYMHMHNTYTLYLNFVESHILDTAKKRCLS
jgi:hypothetical protein